MRSAFRPARSTSSAWNLLKTLVQTALFWSALLWVVPSLLVSVERTWGLPSLALLQSTTFGWVVLAAASVGNLWAGITMSLRGAGTPFPLDTARRLVQAGPYRYVRNPMVVFGLTQGLGVGLVTGSWLVLVYVLAGGLFWHSLVRPLEEKDLLARFGPAYGTYRTRVGLWIPRRRDN